MKRIYSKVIRLIMSLALLSSMFSFANVQSVKASGPAPLWNPPGGVQVSDAGTSNSISQGNTSRKLAITPDGTIYVLFHGDAGIRVAKSTDRGNSFSPSVQINSSNLEAEIAASSNGNVYVIYSQSGSVYFSKSTDKGATFSTPVNIGAANGTVHMDTDDNYIYIIDQNGTHFYYSSDNGATFTLNAIPTSYVYSDVHVDSSTHQVVIQKDNPSLRYYTSDDHGKTLKGPVDPSGQVFYSVSALSSGALGHYNFVAGQGTTSYKYDLDNQKLTTLTFGNNTTSQGRSISADAFGNVVTGYSDGTNVTFAVSQDLGATFGSPVTISGTTIAESAINTTNGDILFAYESNGKVYLAVYAGLLQGYKLNLSTTTVSFPNQNAANQTVILQNTSNQTVTINSITPSGPFTVTSDCGNTLAPNAQCNLHIGFNPAGAGTFTGSVAIDSDAFNIPRVILLTGTSTANPTKWITFKNDDFSNANQVNLFSLNGNASVVTDNQNRKVLRLTPASGNKYGTAFNKALIAPANNYSFSTSFAFRMSNGGGIAPGHADGITFAIQTQSSNAGTLGSGIGYQGITPSFAVKYDSFPNGSPNNDPSDNYIGLAQNGNVNNTNPSWYYDLNQTSFKLYDGNVYYSWIDYDGVNKTVKVYINNANTRPAAPVLNVPNIDLGTIFGGQPGVYAGFTAATGGAWENHDILSWDFTNKFDPIDTTQYTYKQAPTKVTVNAAPTGQPGKYSVIATVYDVDGNPVPGAPITFTSTQGTLTAVSGTSLSDLQSDNNGQGTAILDFGSLSPSGKVTATAIGGAYTTVTIPSAPTGLSAVTTSQTAATLTWNSVNGAASYNIYKNGSLYAANVTAPTYNVTGLVPGTFSVFTLTAVTNGFESAPSNSVTVPKSVGLNLDSTSYTLPIGATHSTVVTSVYSDGSSFDITNKSSFSSSNPNIATIGSNGLVTAVGAGTTIIQAVYGGASVQANVTVTIAAPTGVTTTNITSTGATIHWNAVTGAQSYNIYDNGKLIASGVQGTSYSVTGLTAGTNHSFTVTAVSNGIESSASESASAAMSTLSDLLVDLGSYTLPIGAKHQTVTNAVYLDQSITDVSKLATYSSSNPEIASVDANGLVTAISPGTATITSTFGGKTATATVLVVNAVPNFSITLTTSPKSVVGDGKSQVTLSASVVSTSGNPVANVPITFHFGKGSAADQTVITNAQGIASMAFTAPNINGINPVNEVIVATATDPTSKLSTQQSIAINYMPASVQGFVIDKMTGKPVAGAKVSVTADFNGDGVIDFSSTVTTGPDGSYQIYVPRGNFTYTLNIQTPVQVGNQTVMLNQTQTATVGQLNGTGQTIASANKISGQLFISRSASNSSNSQPTIGSLFGTGNVSAVVQGTNGNNFSYTAGLDANGNFDVNNVPQGQYIIKYQIKAPDGSILAGPSVSVSINQNGEMGVVYSLIDPYGIVTDAYTGQPVSGINMTLYWADTPLNRQNGHTPNTPVNLPELSNFAPNQNHNPQITDAAGEYGWMVFPNADYYIVATKPGYTNYNTLIAAPNVPAVDGSDSYIQNGIIHVGQTIVSFSYSMKKQSSSSSGSGGTFVSGNAPTGLTTSSITSAGVLLNWDVMSGVESYNIYDNGKVIASNVTGTSYQVTGLTAGSSHIFTVSAVVNGTETKQSVSKSITMAADTASITHESGHHEKYIEGYPDGTFKSERNVTREEVAAMLFRVYHLSKSALDGMSYSDVSHADWGADEIAAVTKAGFMNGYPDGTFRPNQPITREEMAGIVARLKNLQGTGMDVFTDISGSWARDAIYLSTQAGILKGYEDGTFRPKANATRAEVVTMINRLMNRGPLTGVGNPTWSDVNPSYWAYGDIEEASTDHDYMIQDNKEVQK
ncbi:S-layer homology domain-containing protein [Paenibacillus filicis]|uniref:Intimin n=1 Tax=Paenibacillus gyeongsangnamensis TaxID=3388067 RepID=A0ABT4QIN8_9BACL|nr:S-layer homology domain-containing protein [Paenibacillus filicis]MCZ8516550.1 S-layer homology domain-containing protein [Paenibacillus filicis]